MQSVKLGLRREDQWYSTFQYTSYVSHRQWTKSISTVGLDRRTRDRSFPVRMLSSLSRACCLMVTVRSVVEVQIVCGVGFWIDSLCWYTMAWSFDLRPWLDRLSFVYIGSTSLSEEEERCHCDRVFCPWLEGRFKETELSFPFSSSGK